MNFFSTECGLMNTSFLSRYHVDEVPPVLRPILYLYAYGISAVSFLYFILVHFTSRIEVLGRERIVQEKNFIFCFWHTYICIYFTVFLKNRRHAWLQHPAWYIKTSHVLLRYVGVEKIILGSSGHSGKKAADQLVDYLKRGYSTVILPDGPNGPPTRMKKGVLHISLQSGAPIIPLRFKAAPWLVLPNWDRRKWPLPFSRIVVEFGEPIHVSPSNFNSVQETISDLLG